MTALASGLAACALLLVACRQESQLPKIGPAPSFALVDQHQALFGSAELRGKVYLADFIFTSCTDVCPLLSGKMAQLQERLRADGLLGSKVVLVSFTVDPERDTPAVLAAYGERFGADPAGWRLLSGARAELEAVAVGFKIGPLQVIQRLSGGEIVHTSRFVLVDPAGEVRAYPRGDELDVDEVAREARLLAR